MGDCNRTCGADGIALIKETYNKIVETTWPGLPSTHRFASVKDANPLDTFTAHITIQSCARLAELRSKGFAMVGGGAARGSFTGRCAALTHAHEHIKHG